MPAQAPQELLLSVHYKAEGNPAKMQMTMRRNRIVRAKRRILGIFLMTVLLLHCAPLALAREEKAEFLSGGKIINVYLFIPDRKGKFPVVIILHGMGKITDVFGWATGLQAQGIGSAVVEYFDACPPPSPRYMRPWLKVGQDTITYLQRLSWVDPTRIAVLGGSLGAILGCLLTASDQRVIALAEVSGDMPSWANVKRMPPTLIIHGKEDKTIGVAGAYKLASILKRIGAVGEMQIYPDVGHDVSNYGEDSTKKIVWFFARYLRPTKPRPATAGRVGS